MIIRREHKRRSFLLILTGKGPLHDVRLSFKAKGMLCYLLGRPEHWTVSIEDLLRRSTDGRDAVLAGMRELRKYGYAVIRTVQDKETGKLEGREWVIFEKAKTPSNGFPVGRRVSPVPLPRIPLKGYMQGGQAGFNKQELSLGIQEGHNSASKAAVDLCQDFYKYLIQHRLHLSRSDLPRGDSIAAKKRRRSTFRKWVQFAEELLEQFENDAERIQRTMKWYFDHYRDRGLGIHHSMNTFCENFHKIEKVQSWREDTVSDGTSVSVQRSPQSTVIKGSGIDPELW